MNNFPIGDKPSSKGPMLGTIIIVILIIIGGIYIISSRRDGETVLPPGGVPADTTPIEQSGTPTGVIPTGTDNQAAVLDGLKSVEADLNSSETDLQNLDQELQ